MPTFNSLKEFIQTLYNERTIIDSLFQWRRKTITLDMLMNLVEDNQERINKLVDKSILSINNNIIELDERLLDFFENFLEVNELINTAFVSQHIELLRNHINYFFEETLNRREKEKYLKEIKKDLKRIGKTITRNVIDLRRNIDDVYKQETNYQIKRNKLNDYRRKRDDIETLIVEIDKILDDKLFVQNAQDGELEFILYILKNELREARDNLLEIQRQIIEYINHILLQTEIYKKVQKIKYLKDQHELLHRTDIEKVLNTNFALFLQPNIQFFTNLSISFLQTDEGYSAIGRVYSRKKEKRIINVPVEGSFANNYLENIESKELLLNTKRIKDSFLIGGDNLFSFILDNTYTKELEFSIKVNLFCKIASMYEEDLIITEEYKKHENIEYAVIKPKR